MGDIIVILVGTVLVNNFVLTRFLGLCPFLGVSKNLEAAAGMSLATTFVLTMSSAIAYLLHTYVLVPFEIEYLRTITFILVIAASVQFTEIMVRRLSPLLDQVLGIFIPLIATNCAVLGVALLNVQQSNNFVESVFFGLGAAGGFAAGAQQSTVLVYGRVGGDIGGACPRAAAGRCREEQDRQEAQGRDGDDRQRQ